MTYSLTNTDFSDNVHPSLDYFMSLDWALGPIYSTGPNISTNYENTFGQYCQFLSSGHFNLHNKTEGLNLAN